jgi:hypothetical protein
MLKKMNEIYFVNCELAELEAIKKIDKLVN